MARCKLTRMSLRNIRKDKQYQCIVIDFVRTGVIGKSKAEELLGYTIPAGLLQGNVTEPAEEEPSSNEYSGDGPSTKFTVVYNPGGDSNSVWGEAELDMTDLNGEYGINATTLDNIKAALEPSWFPQLGSSNGTVKDCNAIRAVRLNPDAVLSNNYYSARKYIYTSISQISPGDIVEIYKSDEYSGNNSYSGC